MVLESGDWESGFARVVGVVTGAESSINRGLEAVKAEIASVGVAMQQTGGVVEAAAEKFSFGQAAEAGVRALGQISGALEGLRSEFNRAGGASDDLADHLRGAFGDAADAAAKLAEQQIVLGFKAEDIAQVEQTLQKFSANSVENLKRVEDAATATGRGMDGLAQGFGRLSEAADEKGVRTALKGLQADLGASNLELQKFGAKLDENNKILLDTPARINAAKNAVVAFSDANFAGAAERAADETTRLAGEMELLKREIGSNVIAFKEGFSPALREAVAELRGLPDGVKAFIGLGTEFVSIGATMATTALQMGANLVLLSGNATACSIAVKGLALASQGLAIAFSAAGIAAGAILAGFVLTTNAINDQTAAMEALIQQENKRNQGLQQNKDLIGKTAEEIVKMGKTAADVQALINGLQEGAQAARAAGNEAGAAKIQAQIAAAIKARGEIAAAEAKAKKDALGNPDDLSQKERDKADRASKKAQAEADRDQKKKDRETEAARKAALAEELGLIHEQAAARQINKAQEIQALQEVANSARVNGAERLRIELDISRLKGQIRAEEKSAEDKKNAQAVRDAAKTAREAAQAKKKAEAEEKAAQKKDDTQQKVDTGKIQASGKQKNDAEKKILDEQIKTAQDTAEKTHKSTLPIIAEALKKKLDLTIQEINKERDLAVAATENESVKVAAVDAAEARVREARAESTRALLDETEKQKRALQSVIDKTDEAAKKPQGLTITGGAISVEQFAQESQAREAATLARRDEIRKGNATANPAFTPSIFGTAKTSELEKNIVAKRPESPSSPAQQMATALAEIIKGQPIAITIENNFPGEAKQSKTFSGPVGTLEKAKSVFNAKHALGAP